MRLIWVVDQFIILYGLKYFGETQKYISIHYNTKHKDGKIAHNIVYFHILSVILTF